MTRFIALALGILSMCLGVHANEAKRPVIAVIPTGGAGALTALLETRLSHNDRYVVVDRERIAEVIKEWELSAFSTASSVSKRMEMGRLLGADLLVFLTEGATPAPHCEMVISETSRGIRLRLSTLATSKEPQNDAKDIETEIESALKKQAEGFVRICAVPPFVSMDLSATHNHLKTAYARMLETMLLQIPGTLVVEIAEAREIAEETELTGAKVERVLPVYFLGEYRFDAANPENPPYLRLIAKRGEQVAGTREIKDMTPASAASFLRDSTMELLEKTSGGVPQQSNPKAESQILATRAKELITLGYYEECVQAAEASLLLEPAQPELLRLAVVAYRERCFNKDRALEVLPYCERALVHKEQYLLQIDYKKYDPSVTSSIGEAFNIPVRDVDNETKQAVQAYRKRVRDAYLRILETKRQQGALNDAILNLVFTHWRNWPGDYGEPLRKNLQQRLEIADMILETNLPTCLYFIRKLIDDDLEDEVKQSLDYAWFTNQMKQRDHPAVRAGFKMKADFDAEQQAKRDARKNAKNTDPVTTPTGPSEIEFIPLNLKSSDNKDFTFQGVLSCGEGIDLFWGWGPSGARSAYLMKTKDVLEPIFHGINKDSFGQPTFDGKYAWLPVIGPSCGVLAIDVASGSAVRFTAEDGLHPFRFAASATLGQGRLCLSAGFGDQTNRRAYIAVLELITNGRKKVEIIHEAAKQFLPGESWEEVKFDPQLSYAPQFMISDPGKNGKSWQVMLKRGYSCLWIEPDTRAVKVVDVKVDFDPALGAITFHQNGAYWASEGGLFRLGVDATQQDRVRDIPEDGSERERVLIHNGQLHVVGWHWWMADGLDKPLRKLEGKVPGRLYDYRELYHSSHYGIIFTKIYTSGSTYQVIFRQGLLNGPRP